MTAKALGLIVAGLLVLTACGDDDTPEAASTPGPTSSPAASPTESAAESATASATASASDSPSAAASDELSEENVIRERLYFDVSGHSFTLVDPTAKPTLGPCTGEKTFEDALPSQGVTLIGSTLEGKDGRHVIEQLAQTGSAKEAATAAAEIVSLVDECAAISGGDFGYGDPVTFVSTAEMKIVYFPAFDSDTVFGGYVVFAVGTRIGVIDVADSVSKDVIATLAKEAAAIAAF